ncbi:MAG: M14 family zinc carboxypeptidase [Saprospiraceae bacterium]|nr:M14 family zinc carboxypeptidase [Saprospiraceae bacterium]
MRFLLFTFAWLLFASCLLAQASERYVRVGISLEGRDIAELAQLGLETDHGLHLPGVLWVADLSESELAQVRQAGFEVKIWIDDLQKDYEARVRETEARNFPCPSGAFPNYPAPVNYTYGSMGGYHTLDEMMAVLDNMRAKFPHLISARAPITSAPAHTWEGRKIWYVRLSDNPDTDEAEPEVLYTALHHAREPNSASQMLYFMWYLLENYATDAQVRYIVDNAELYFIPCLNPDGYVYNQTIKSTGGGMWRKNRRDNGNGAFGVDLNRNYGHFWGLSDLGSSPNPSSETYRGPEAFSEPETRAIRDFVLAHNFVFAQNYHTHGNLLIHPWGYSDDVASPDFPIYSGLFTRENSYRTGTAGQTVGYAVNGVSDDWMHADAGAYAFTPEVGNAFWPSPAQIETLNRRCLWMNLATALSALRYGEARDLSPPFFQSLSPKLPIEFVRWGQQNGPFVLSLTALTPNVAAISPAEHLIAPALFSKTTLNFDVQLTPNLSSGQEVVLLLRVSNGAFTRTDTLRKIYGALSLATFKDNAVNLNNWSGSWGLTDLHSCSAPNAFTDSPNGAYAPNTESRFASRPISIPAHARAARLRFCARWQVEPVFDYVQVRAFNASTDVPLCGRYTKPATGPNQPFGEPIYDGQQLQWVNESMDLSAFIGQTFRIAFALKSDGSFQMDGFYFDDLVVEYDDLSVSAPEPSLSSITLQGAPNPADEYAFIRWEGGFAVPDRLARLVVFDALGRPMGEWPVELSAPGQVCLPTAQWPQGTYFYRIQGASGVSPLQRLMVLHP